MNVFIEQKFLLRRVVNILNSSISFVVEFKNLISVVL